MEQRGSMHRLERVGSHLHRLQAAAGSGSKELGVCVVGAGRMGTFHANNLSAIPGVRVVRLRARLSRWDPALSAPGFPPCLLPLHNMTSCHARTPSLRRWRSWMWLRQLLPSSPIASRQSPPLTWPPSSPALKWMQSSSQPPLGLSCSGRCSRWEARLCREASRAHGGGIA